MVDLIVAVFKQFTFWLNWKTQQYEVPTMKNLMIIDNALRVRSSPVTGVFST